MFARHKLGDGASTSRARHRDAECTKGVTLFRNSDRIVVFHREPSACDPTRRARASDSRRLLRSRTDGREVIRIAVGMEAYVYRATATAKSLAERIFAPAEASNCTSTRPFARWTVGRQGLRGLRSIRDSTLGAIRLIHVT